MIITVILRKLYVHCSARDPFLDLYARKIQQPNFPIMNELTKVAEWLHSRALGTYSTKDYFRSSNL